MNTTQKKVLFFVPEYPVLSQTFIEKEIAKLIERGNLEIKVLSLKKSAGSFTTTNSEKSVLYHRINTKDILGGIVIIILNPLKIFKALQVLLKSKKRGFLSKIYLFLKSLAYSFYIKNLSIDHIHAHFMSESSTLMLMVSFITGIPLSISAHAKDVTVDSELVPDKVRWSKFVSVCNKNAFEECIRQAGDENRNKILLQYHGLDLTKYQDYKSLKNSKKTTNEASMILNVGRLEEKKGQTYLIDAAKILREKGLNFVLNIVGGGSLYNQLNQKILKENLQETVFIIGSGNGVPHTQVLELFSKADIFVLPSIKTESGDEEGIPNTILEAGYFELPVVTTNTGSISEVVQNDVSGLISNEKDPLSLAKCIENILGEREFSDDLAGNLSKIVHENFDLNQTVQKLEKSLIQE